jgi:hypothetical protein
MEAMRRETFRLWSLLRKGSVFSVIFLVVSLSFEIQTYLAASATRDVELVWSIPPEQDVAGYNVYYGPVSRYEDGFDEYLYTEDLRPGDYEVREPKVHYVLASLDENLSYWVSITAYDHNGNESVYSNEKKIGVPSDTTVMESSSGGCQSVPISLGSRVGGRAALTGWIFLFVVVPAWILRLRKRFS